MMTALQARLEALSVPEPNSGCWLWLGTTARGGYGRITLGRRSANAHRASWLAYHGAIPPSLHVLHRCDVRSCVNPDHLFLGTNRDNIADKVAKGRQARNAGELHPSSRLRSGDVRAIYSDERPLRAIAHAFEVSKQTVSDIRAGRSWAHVTGGAPQRRPKPMGEAQGTAKLTVALVRAVRADTRSQGAIAKAFGISQSAVSRIRSRESWPHVD